MVVNPLLNRVLGDVWRVNRLGSVYVIAELPVVDFLGVTEIAISTCDQGEVNRVWGHQAKSFQNADELVGSYVLALGTVKVVEARLEENSLGDDLMVESLHDLDEALAVRCAHEGSRLCFFYGGRWVSSVRENVVQIVAEI